jgi:hypothetical protein
MALTDKQQRFVAEYLVDLNATQAAIRAGYEWPNSRKAFYVYFLIDPRTDKIFYVGKGTNNRIKGHVNGAIAGRHSNGAKDFVIREISMDGEKVGEVIFADGMKENDALACEADLIEILRDYELTNIRSGSVSTLVSAERRIDTLIMTKKSYDVWINTARDQAISAVNSVFGSPENFYAWYSDSLVKVKSRIAANG